MKSKNIQLFTKENWKRLLICLLILMVIYTKYTSYRVEHEVTHFLENNEFMQYSLTEYIDYFTKNGYETSYSVGEEYLTKNTGLYSNIDYYSDNSFGVGGEKNGGFVRVDYSETLTYDNNISPETIYWIKNADDSTLPLIYGIQWDDSYKEIKRKIGINIFNNSLPYLNNINEKSFECSDHVISIKCPKINIKYCLWFDDHDMLERINIFSDNLKLQ